MTTDSEDKNLKKTLNQLYILLEQGDMAGIEYILNKSEVLPLSEQGALLESSLFFKSPDIFWLLTKKYHFQCDNSMNCLWRASILGYTDILKYLVQNTQFNTPGVENFILQETIRDDKSESLEYLFSVFPSIENIAPIFPHQKKKLKLPHYAQWAVECQAIQSLLVVLASPNNQKLFFTLENLIATDLLVSMRQWCEKSPHEALSLFRLIKTQAPQVYLEYIEHLAHKPLAFPAHYPEDKIKAFRQSVVVMADKLKIESVFALEEQSLNIPTPEATKAIYKI